MNRFWIGFHTIIPEISIKTACMGRKEVILYHLPSKEGWYEEL